MLGGLIRYLQLTASARTGLSGSVAALALAAVVCAATAFALLVLAAYVWLAEAYSQLTAALMLAFAFFLLAVVAAVAVGAAQRRTSARAARALAARSPAAWYDPATLAIMLQIGRGIGLRRIVPLLAVGFLAAGLAREWSRPEAGNEEGSDGQIGG